MKVILKNPTRSIINQVLAKEGLTIGWPDLDDIDLSEYENELYIEDVIDIKDMTRIASSDFALYKKDRVIYVNNSDFSEMEVRL
jgi:hypothetical protein